MDTSKLKKFAQHARRSLIEQVSNKLKLVLAKDSAARRESAAVVAKLEKQIQTHGKEQVIEKVAYIWFNRFCALRFMDVNRYTRIGVVSPAEGQIQPEILADAKMGHIDESMVNDAARQKIFSLLDGKIPSQDPQAEAYRLLVVAICNYWHGPMPFMFEQIADYTELLMPDDLLSDNSILSLTREAMTPETCEDVEVIGWLYQFYISEKKDEVFEGLKKNKKITPENIPAATQLFTPHWIVRYLVENSLGRLWMLNHPDSKLIEQMDYYIKPEQPESDFLHISSPEEIKVCDPACGSGHMLTYAFDLLYAIYEEEGYEPAEIPEKILTQNLYGIEIDERAGELAAFALTMKARAKQRRFFRKQVLPNICVLESPDFDATDIAGLLSIPIAEEAEQLLEDNCNIEYSLYWKKLSKDYKKKHNKDIDNNLFQCIPGALKKLTSRQHLDILLSKTEEWRGKRVNLLECIEDPGMVEAFFFLELLKRVEPFKNYLLELNEFKNFGSLIKPLRSAYNILIERQGELHVDDMYDSVARQKIDLVLQQLNYLEPVYHVVIANPPYMGGKGINGRLGRWAKDNYPNSKSDLFAMFIERNLELAHEQGVVAMITMQSWMFLSSFEKLRTRLLNQDTILSMAHLGARAFDSIGGEVVSTTAFVLENQNKPEYKGGYLRLIDGNSEVEKEGAIREAIKNPDCGWFYRASAADFKKIPGKPIAYWVSNKVISAFENEKPLFKCYPVKSGIMTGNDPLFLRAWQEVDVTKITFGLTSEEQMDGQWYPLSKGGEFRKWYGNVEHLINLRDDAFDIRNGGGNFRLREKKWYFQPYVTWSRISSSSIAFRYLNNGVLFADAAPGIFAGEKCTEIISLLNSKLGNYFLAAINPTMNYQTNDIERIPSISIGGTDKCRRLIDLARLDWDFYETSWDFSSLPLLHRDHHQPTLATTYQAFRAHGREITLEMQRLEEENNRIFIDAYGLQNELTPEVSLSEITLTCNPHYRYNGDKSEEELEALLLADTMKEFISYAVGCMFGRYALDKPGLILANQGETIDDYLKQIPEPVFPVDDDNVIPMLDGNWFTDDITERFYKFLRVTFGEEHYEENLEFIEQAIGKNIRKYFLKDFYADHVKRYKKRPIYWLFSSPKGSFNALIYMHRYRPDTVSVILNDYLHNFLAKLISRKDHLEAVSISASATAGEKTRALKEIEKINKMITELEEYERDVLYPLATEQVEIDLDDGVKVNYAKFGKALKKITGLN